MHCPTLNVSMLTKYGPLIQGNQPLDIKGTGKPLVGKEVIPGVNKIPCIYLWPTLDYVSTLVFGTKQIDGGADLHHANLRMVSKRPA